jgi:hypothetical protein
MIPKAYPSARPVQPTPDIMDLFLMIPSIALIGLVTFLFGTGYVEAPSHRPIRR